MKALLTILVILGLIALWGGMIAFFAWFIKEFHIRW